MKRSRAIHGVNLGGWLVLEPWITPSLFKGMPDIRDEYRFCDTASPVRTKQLKEFRRRWVTEDDFKWLQEHGIEAVRIPVGYWLFGDEPPYVGTVDFLDKAFAWGRKHDIKVLVCLHGALGSQNGNDHSGQIGAVGWGSDDTVRKTMDVLRKLVARYQDHSALLGFELLNEPSPTIGKRRLKRYYRQAYTLIRRQCAPGTWVVIGDCFQPARWSFALHWPWYRDVYLDLHQYQVFTPHDKALDIAGHIEKTERIGRKLRWLGWHRRYIIGEWSASLDPQSLHGLDDTGKSQAYRSYMAAQLAAYDRADAWFYWNYKTESGGAWSYRAMISSGQPTDAAERL